RLFDRALRQEHIIDDRGNPGPSGPFSIISHSFGAIVVRLWMELYYPRGDCPVRRHLMLAPPNSGSRLASAGRRTPDAFFNLGRAMLQELELGSFFLWDLNTLYVKSGKPDQPPYLFVFAGLLPENDGSAYPKGAGEAESDGKVRAASANLNILRINRRGESQEGPRTAFFVFPDHGHSGPRGLAGHIPARGWEGDAVVERILQCLRVNSAADYRGLCESCYPRDLRRSQLMVRVRDQYGRDVPDVLAEFMVDEKRSDGFILHARSDSPFNALALYLDAVALKARARKAAIRISRRPSGHFNYGTGVTVPLLDHDGALDRLRPGRSTMVEVMLTRSTRGARFEPGQPRPTAGPADLPRGPGYDNQGSVAQC
ncbi:MAG: hypothetical protein N3A38_16810, partial [Planctomycetota bacterium]|nr:hypothetical protein [Planctomycetota bacterium]